MTFPARSNEPVGLIVALICSVGGGGTDASNDSAADAASVWSTMFATASMQFDGAQSRPACTLAGKITRKTSYVVDRFPDPSALVYWSVERSQSS